MALATQGSQDIITGMVVCEAQAPHFPIISVSESYCQLTGYGPDEIIGQSAKFLQGQDTDPKIIASIQRAIQSGQAFSGEIVNYTKSGERFVNSFRIEPVFDSQGDLIQFVGTQSGRVNGSKDFKLNHQLQKSHQTNEMSCDMAFFELSDQLDVLKISCGIVGLDERFFLHEVNWEQIIDPQDYPAFKAGLAGLLNQSHDSMVIENLKITLNSIDVKAVKVIAKLKQCGLNNRKVIDMTWVNVSVLSSQLSEQKNKQGEIDLIYAELQQVLDHLENGQFDFPHNSFYRHHPVLKQVYRLATTLKTVNQELTRFTDDIANKGQLGGQLKFPDAKGGWRTLVGHVNSMATLLTRQVREVVTVATAVAEGDLSQKIELESHGEIADFKLTLNNMVDQLNIFYSEVNRVADEVGTQGVLGSQAEVPNAKGKWHLLTGSVNRMADNLTEQVRNISDVATAVAQGDLSQKITADVQGELLALKTTVNTMVDNLRLFSTEVIQTLQDFGQKGILGRIAHVPHVQGCWLELTDQVNIASMGLTEQVRKITAYAQQLSDGYLENTLDFESPGQINVLVESLLKIQTNLSKTAVQAEKISQGDFSGEIALQSAHDQLNTQLVKMTQSLKIKTEQLQARELLLDEFLTYSQDVFIRLDLEYKIISASQAFENITGLDKNQWIRQSFFDVADLDQETFNHIVDPKTKSDLGQRALKIKGPFGLKVFDIVAWQVLDVYKKPKEYHLMARDFSEYYQVIERNKLYNTMQDNSSILYGVMNLTTFKAEYVNQAIVNFLNKSPESEDVYLSDFHSPEEIEFIKATQLPHLMEKGFWEGEKMISFPNTVGIARPYYTQSRLIQADNGDQLCACVMIDISEQKEAERQIKEQQKQISLFQEILDNSPIMFGVLDVKTQKHLYMSKAFLSKLPYGTVASDVSILDVHTEQEWDEIKKTFVPIVTSKGSWSGRLTLSFPMNPKQSPMNVLGQVTHVQMNGDNPLSIACFLDLSEQIKLEDKIKEQQTQLDIFKDLQDQSPIMYFVGDKVTQRILHQNQAAKNLFPNKEETFIRDYHNSEQMNYLKGTIIPALAAKGEWSGRYDMFIHGKFKPCYAHVSQKDAFIYAMFVDKTKELKWELQRKNQQKQFDRVMRLSLASEVSSGIAHQLNQPLTALSTTLQMWDAEVDDSRRVNDIKDKLPHMVKLSLKMGDIIHSVNHLLTQKPTYMEGKKVNISLLVEDMISEFKEIGAPKSIQLNFMDHSKKLMADLNFDPILLRLSLQNLINNAVESLESSKVKDAQINIHMVKKDSLIEIHVADNGPGVPYEDLNKIFEPFYSTKHSGTGTGLSLIKRLSEQYPITIEYDKSNCDVLQTQGACFKMTLPVDSRTVDQSQSPILKKSEA